MQNFFKYQDSHTSGGTAAHVFNMPKLMSSANRKEFHNVDYSGNAQLYTIGMKLFGANAEALITTAPNMYATARAVKAWHDARVKMFRRAGIKMKDLGYGRSFRPYLDVNHENGTTTEIDTENATSLGITPHFQGDEWTYSRAAVATPADEGNNTGYIREYDLVDTYSFTLCGASVVESTTDEDAVSSGDETDEDSFVSVGMISEWLDSFRLKAAAQAGNELGVKQLDADNALLQLVSVSGPQTEEVLELAEEGQVEQRPWDAVGTAYSSLTVQGYAHTILAGSDYVVFQAPCGLFNLATQNNHGSTDVIGATFKVLAIEDM